MKVTVQEQPHLRETEVVILCQQVDGQVTELFSLLSGFGRQLTGSKEGRIYPVDAAEVLYIESVDRRTFLYTTKDVLESPQRLYELEGLLQGAHFIRASKSSLVNLQKLQYLQPTFGGRIEATLINGEQVLFSRQYSAALKTKLDLR